MTFWLNEEYSDSYFNSFFFGTFLSCADHTRNFHAAIQSDSYTFTKIGKLHRVIFNRYINIAKFNNLSISLLVDAFIYYWIH